MVRKTIAFIPVRGGSKSIPLKNIKPFCGKPLVCWTIEALENCSYVDTIVVATDSKIIEETVLSNNYSKTIVFHRSAENASDTASTESVMLEYLNHSGLSNEDVFMLVQATSPLTQTIHFSEALSIFQMGKYDSMLSCVRNKRFFWNSDGESLNYDYRNRPRRQDFEGLFLENGAFYINIVSNILCNKNRLCGKIGVYEMPSYTAMEIDEPDDWFLMENLMYRYVLVNNKKIDVKLFLTDVDGVLTDAGMYYSENGDELKKFNTRDGMGLQLLKKNGIKVGIITSEETKLVENRAKKLGVDFLCQGKQYGGKLDAAMNICDRMGVSLANVAYVGDDLNCKDVLLAVGFPACPKDAVDEIKSIPNILCLNKSGGEGCVREFAEWILNRS